MNSKILLLLFFFGYFQSCKQETKQANQIAKPAIIDHSDQNIHILKQFYNAYFTEMESTNKNSEEKLDLLRKNAMTIELYNKFKNLDLDYDPIINGQDVDENWRKTLKIEYDSKTQLYQICTISSFDKKNNCTYLKMTGNKISDIKVNGIESILNIPIKTDNSADISLNSKDDSFNQYKNNNEYFIKSFDINKDGIEDKIVSSKPYQGEDLIVFFGDNERNFKMSLKTSNFSEDGGNIIKDILPIPNAEGLEVKTFFPDRGFYEEENYIIYSNNSWILKNTIYKVMSDNSENAVKYICNVSQNINITKSGWLDKVNLIPDENERNKKCYIEK